MSSIDELVAADPASLCNESVRVHVRALEVARSRLDHAELQALRQLDTRQVWATDGAYSPANWLAHHSGTARSVAGSMVHLARQLERMPATAAALEEGAITLPHVRVLARCVGPRTYDVFCSDEASLVTKARRLTADELATVVDYWLAHVDQDGPEPSDPELDCAAHMSKTLGGRWRLDADFGALTGTEVNEALRLKCEELWRADRAAAEADPTDPIANRTPSQRRGAALVELLGLGAAADDRACDRRRPAYTALVDLDALHGVSNPDSVHETADGTVLNLADLQLDLCDCLVGRVIMAGASEPVDLGRLVRTATLAQRRALVARDGGCSVKSCDRPPVWCDAHHIRWWENGGTTDLRNLCLLCRHHHRRVHAGHLIIEMVVGTPEVRRADGTPIPDPRGSPDADP